MKRSGIAVRCSDLLAFPVFYDHLIACVIPITDVIRGKTICFSKATHLSLGVGEIAVVVRLFGVINFPFCLKKSSIKNTIIFKTWIKLLEA